MTEPSSLRFPPLSQEEMSAAQRRAYEAIRRFTAAVDRGPFPMMLRSPGAEELMALSDYIRFRISIELRLAEFAILIHARLWTDQYEWQAHEPRALNAGLSVAVVADLKAGRRPAAMRPDEAAVYDFAVALSQHHAVADGTFRRAVELLGEAGVADLTVLLGLYVMVSYVLGVSEITSPPGMTPPLVPLAEPLPLD
ncbi:MAG TPA: carboxymuconolactone decarboxylase family protein [Hyphomicrobiales bacterium]|nr:carboxymuconolactone decarboxylase family protein [Hyphomicrobiales bacterium]